MSFRLRIHRVVVRPAPWLRSLVVAGWLLAGAAGAPAQSTVEEKFAALEARIAQLEAELAASKAARSSPAAGLQEVSAVDDSGGRPFIRPAVLVSPSPGPVLSPAGPAGLPEPAAAQPLPPQDTLGGDLEGLNFFKGVTFGGLVDAYYLFNFNEPTDRSVGFRTFDSRHNSFALNLAELSLNKSATAESPLGYNLTYGLGPTADFVNGADFGDGTTADNFFQYYLSARIPGTKDITLDFGKFVTIHGAEVIETAPNWNYSRGLLFGLAIPFYHFGFRATIPVSETVTLTGLLVNGWDNVLDNNGGKTFGLLFNWAPNDRFSLVQNYMTGPEADDDNDTYRHLFDTLLTVKLHDKVTFMTNFDYGMDRDAGSHVHWIGTANYLRFQLTPTFALTPRFEFFSDPGGFRTGVRQQLKEFTITPEFVVSENLVTRFEFRRDWSNEPAFAVGSPGDDPKVQNTAAVGMLLTF